MFNFDGATKIISVHGGVTEFSATELYSDWKEWAIQLNNLQWLPAFSAVGGDAISSTNNAPTYFFLVNGWKIRPQEADHTLAVAGNLAVEGGLESPFIATLGDFNVQVQTNTTTAPTVTSAGGGASSSQDLINDIIAALVFG